MKLKSEMFKPCGSGPLGAQYSPKEKQYLITNQAGRRGWETQARLKLRLRVEGLSPAEIEKELVRIWDHEAIDINLTDSAGSYGPYNALPDFLAKSRKTSADGGAANE